MRQGLLTARQAGRAHNPARNFRLVTGMLYTLYKDEILEKNAPCVSFSA